MKRIGILTGGGDVPGLNAAIKAFVWRMLDEPCEIIGLRRGWASLVNIIPDASADNSAWLLPLSRLLTRAIDRTGGTILHTSRMNPSIAKTEQVPPHLLSEMGDADDRGRYDLTKAALRVIEFLRLDALVALGGDG
ncbi:MAG: ATP-dependent phosphofructokinase / diphosphate-dependent phosphofructokinase, partial [Acidobacteriota bacterium]|nr:ATP-dependent phosphofructokinase / diphosphate-dependent phosphofructokinase [Acidobacteriota bacterium]